MNYEKQLLTVIQHDNIFNKTRPIRVLMAEDQEINSMIIQKYLKKFPMDIDIAENGKIAIEMYMANEYDLVLMDLRMPEINGYEATKAIRKIDQDKGQKDINIPIFALSASVTSEEVQKCLASGCNEHLKKPLKKEALFEMILNYYDVIVIKTKQELMDQVQT